MARVQAPEDMVRAVRNGDRRALGRAITLVESTRPDHRDEADALLASLLPRTGKSIRIGISGVPGVGKSTFIEAFGLHAIGKGRRVAVLAVDPSSRRGGGSILGDKTRMTELSKHPAAFIRPSPTGGTLGGVARRTAESILVCEAAGFEVVLVETVGVGQSETAVADMTDMFVLLLMPGAGDELQGIKRGIMELAHLLVVNKADGELAAAAGRAAADYANALRLLRPMEPWWQPAVLRCSALTGAGIAEVWETVERFRAAGERAGGIALRRVAQAKSRLWAEIGDTFMGQLRRNPATAKLIPDLERKLAAGIATPGKAAHTLIQAFLGKP